VEENNHQVVLAEIMLINLVMARLWYLIWTVWKQHRVPCTVCQINNTITT